MKKHTYIHTGKFRNTCNVRQHLDNVRAPTLRDGTNVFMNTPVSPYRDFATLDPSRPRIANFRTDTMSVGCPMNCLVRSPARRYFGSYFRDVGFGHLSGLTQGPKVL